MGHQLDRNVENKSHCTSCRDECHNNVTGHHGCHKINVTGHRECHKLMSFDIMNDTKLMSQMSLNIINTLVNVTEHHQCHKCHRL